MALPDHISHCTLLPSTMVVLQEAMAGKKPEGNEHKISKRKGEELTVSQVSLHDELNMTRCFRECC